MAKIHGHDLRVITKDFCYLEESEKSVPISDMTDQIIKTLQLKYSLGSRRLFYKDTSGAIDEIIIASDRAYYFREAPNEIVDSIINILHNL
jgi:hypothetical protein